MEIDKTTLTDLSIFNAEEEFSLFNKLNFCITTLGKDKMHLNFSNPLKSIEEIEEVQQTLQFIIANHHKWTSKISNGTVMVVRQFYETVIDPIPNNNNIYTANSYKIFHSASFSLAKYSAQHCFDFIKGLQEIIQHFLIESAPPALRNFLNTIKKTIEKKEFNIIAQNKKASELPITNQLNLASFLKYKFKNSMFELLDIFTQLDAWYGMAQAVIHYNLVFPKFYNHQQPLLNCQGLFHLLLPYPVSYKIELNQDTNFLFLTGANMAGKSTFIKSVGAAVFLAHLGMGVPAQQMQLTYFDGILSNINVIDNLIKGESYFYNEVQRIKATLNKVKNNKKWLILIDELFKGTNVQDAMKCSSTVIEGLLKINNSLFILSTHLYEIGEDLKKYSNINFKYFETKVIDDQLHFSYQLKEGISNDRLGYLILKKEGVVDLLNNISFHH